MYRLSLICLLLSLLLPACEGNTRERRDARGETYVSDPDHLYFLNVRSRDYRSVTVSQGLDAYSHDDFPTPAPLVIQDNWFSDRAELILNDRPLSPQAADSLNLALSSGKDGSFPDDLTRQAARETLDDYLRLISYSRTAAQSTPK